MTSRRAVARRSAGRGVRRTAAWTAGKPSSLLETPAGGRGGLVLRLVGTSGREEYTGQPKTVGVTGRILVEE